MSLTKQDKIDIENIVVSIVDTKVNKAVEDLAEVINSLALNMHKEILNVHKELETKASQSSIDRLINTIDGFIKRLDEVETEQTARDAQFEKLLSWAREVSVKTGIPLNGL